MKIVMAIGGAGLAGLATVLAVALGGNSSPSSTVESTPTAPAVVTAAGTGEDASGPCDEAEHRNDPRCAGATTPTAPTTTTAEREPGEDVPGPCDEAEHRDDPRCTGGAAVHDDDEIDDDVDDEDHSGPGRGSDDEDRSGSNSGRG